MRIGIVACESFQRGIDYLTMDDPDIVHKEYLEFGLHEYPEHLKRTVVEKVNALEGQVDAVLLGYGVCNSLRGVTSLMKVPTVQLEGDDCIGVLITTEEYDRERKKCAGTMYHTPYFAKMGRAWFEDKLKEQMPDYAMQGIDVDWFLAKMFEGYSRVLFIDDGLGEMEEFEALSKQFAAEMNLRYESRKGTLSCLIDGLTKVKELASSHRGTDKGTAAIKD